MLSLLQISWQNRSLPLTACAVAARGEAARELARRALVRDDEELAKLNGAAGEGLLILFGETNILPWADGALYLGRDEQAPSLLLPTTIVPDMPLALFERALRMRFAQLPLPLAVLPQWNLVLPCGTAQGVARHKLEKQLGTF
jgi:hypothetical protein